MDLDGPVKRGCRCIERDILNRCRMDRYLVDPFYGLYPSISPALSHLRFFRVHRGYAPI